MDLVEVAGRLALEFSATVSGPFDQPKGATMIQVMRPDGYGVGLILGGTPQPESRPGKIDVWNIRETDDPHIVDWSNDHTMIRFATDHEGARDMLRKVGPEIFRSGDEMRERLRRHG